MPGQTTRRIDGSRFVITQKSLTNVGEASRMLVVFVAVENPTSSIVEVSVFQSVEFRFLKENHVVVFAEFGHNFPFRAPPSVPLGVTRIGRKAVDIVRDNRKEGNGLAIPPTTFAIIRHDDREEGRERDPKRKQSGGCVWVGVRV